MTGRTYAIGGVDGRSAARKALVEAIDFRPEDLFVALGDVVETGPASKGVIERLMGPSRRRRFALIELGHESKLFHSPDGRGDCDPWGGCGGDATGARHPGSPRTTRARRPRPPSVADGPPPGLLRGRHLLRQLPPPPPQTADGRAAGPGAPQGVRGAGIRPALHRRGRGRRPNPAAERGDWTPWPKPRRCALPRRRRIAVWRIGTIHGFG